MAILDNPQEDINTSDVSFMPTAQKWGLYFGAGFVIMTILMSIIGFNFDKMTSLALYGLTTFAAMIALFLVTGIAGIREHRSNLGGFIDFKTAFMVCFVAFSIGIVINSVFSFVYYNYINTSFMDGMKESMINMFDEANVPEASRVDALKSIEDSKTLVGTLIAMLKTIAGSAIFAAIIAAIMKKARPMFG
jgi:hypothetical protein